MDIETWPRPWCSVVLMNKRSHRSSAIHLPRGSICTTMSSNSVLLGRTTITPLRRHSCGRDDRQWCWTCRNEEHIQISKTYTYIKPPSRQRILNVSNKLRTPKRARLEEKGIKGWKWRGDANTYTGAKKRRWFEKIFLQLSPTLEQAVRVVQHQCIRMDKGNLQQIKALPPRSQCTVNKRHHVSERQLAIDRVQEQSYASNVYPLIFLQLEHIQLRERGPPLPPLQGTIRQPQDVIIFITIIS